MWQSALAAAVGWTFHPRRLALARPYRWARGVQLHRDVMLVRLELGGAVGWGEVAPPPDEALDAEATTGAARRLVEGLPDDGFLAGLDARRPPSRLRCGLATAWMDAMARRDGTSLATWLAPATGRQPRETVAVNVLLTDAEPARLQTQAEAAVASGHRAIKLKVGRDEDDVARAEAVRAGASRAELRLDANGAWGDDPLRRMQAFAHLDVAYVEQPVPPGADDVLARLVREGPFPVALDESATDPRRLDELLSAGAGTVAILKPQRLGGPDRTLQAMEVAEARGARAIVTNSLESTVGLHAALHVASLLPDDEACGLATSGFFSHDLGPPPVWEAGRLHVPRPGIGVAPREAP